jgi:hypothetical protein
MQTLRQTRLDRVTDGMQTDEPGLPRPWERQPDESRPAYYAFTVYRDLPPLERSGSRVASECGRSGTLISRWRGQWAWVERSRAWDGHQDAVRRRAQLVEATKMGERQARHAQALQQAMIAPVHELLRRLGDVLEADQLKRLTIGDLMLLSVQTGRVWPAAARAERLARGAPAADYAQFLPGEDDADLAPAEVADTDEHLAEVWLAMSEAGLEPRLQLPSPPDDASTNGGGTNGHG